MKKLSEASIENLICLDCVLKIYIPSKQGDLPFDNTQVTEDTLTFLSSLFGGSTKFEAYGCYRMRTGKLIQEHICICQAFGTSDDFREHIDKIYSFCQKLKADLNQDSIGLEVNNLFYLVI
jgi:hypothetical protein